MKPLKPKELRTFYMGILPAIREVARQHGYAIGAHGSFQSDLDLIAVPWTEEAKPQEILVKAICEVADCTFRHQNKPEQRIKPYGRQAWTLIFNKIPSEVTGMAYIDLSITARV